MVWLARLLLFSYLGFASMGIFSLKFTPARIIEVLLVVFAIFLWSRLGPVRETTISLMKWALALILVKFIIDNTVHIGVTLTRFTETFFYLLRESFVVLMLPVFEKIGYKRIRLVETTVIASVPAIVLGYLQIRNPTINLPSLLSDFGVLVFPSIETHLFDANRMIGTFDRAIGLALVLGMLCVIVWTRGFMGGSFKCKVLSVALFLVSYILIIFTQTRSAIYGIFPSLLVANLLTGGRLARKLAVVGIVGVIALSAFSAFEAFVVKYSERSRMQVDANTYYKITANVYGTYAALAANPLFGIPRETGEGEGKREFKEMVKKGRRELGEIVKAPGDRRLEATDHNFLAYYARFYGLVGFCLLCVVIFKMLKKINMKQESGTRFMLYGLLVFFLQYSLLHNNRLLQDVLLWCSLAYGTERNENLSADDGLQRPGQAAFGD
ncbi:MAG: hypothetical protein U9N47_11300 [Thermodesulfobacteriota bacterium]|nr:hypothetical protein [Thermodesulfobacteriota bacterium]